MHFIKINISAFLQWSMQQHKLRQLQMSLKLLLCCLHGLYACVRVLHACCSLVACHCRRVLKHGTRRHAERDNVCVEECVCVRGVCVCGSTIIFFSCWLHCTWKLAIHSHSHFHKKSPCQTIRRNRFILGTFLEQCRFAFSDCLTWRYDPDCRANK